MGSKIRMTSLITMCLGALFFAAIASSVTQCMEKEISYEQTIQIIHSDDTRSRNIERKRSRSFED